MTATGMRNILIVVVTQIAPSPIAVDSAGRVQGVLGFGTGQYESIMRSCEGNILATSPVKFEGAGVTVDAWPTRTFRTSGFAGVVSADNTEWSGGYAGGLAALEFQHFGIGLGMVRAPSDGTWPVAYLRGGSRDALHARLELAPPDPPLGTAGTARLGVHYRMGHIRNLGVGGGIALCHAVCDDSDNVALFGRMNIPIASSIDVEIGGLLGPGEKYMNAGLFLAGRFHFLR